MASLARAGRSPPPDQRQTRAARRFTGATAVVEQVETWGAPDAEGNRRGSVSLTVRGAPVALQADTELATVRTGTRYRLAGTLDVRVPLFGGTVERALAPLLTGLVRCGRCGRAMRVFYGSASGHAHRYFCRGDDSHVGGWLCIGIGGIRVDRAVAAHADRLIRADGRRATAIEPVLRPLN